MLLLCVARIYGLESPPQKKTPGVLTPLPPAGNTDFNPDTQMYVNQNFGTIVQGTYHYCTGLTLGPYPAFSSLTTITAFCTSFAWAQDNGFCGNTVTPPPVTDAPSVPPS